MPPERRASQTPGVQASKLAGDLFELGGAGPLIVDLAQGVGGAAAPGGQVRIGVDLAGELPATDADSFDILFTARRDPPAPWVCVASGEVGATIADLHAAIERQPVAAAVAAQVMRMTLKLGFDDALALESLGYSMLLASEGFRAWRAANPPRARAADDAARVSVDVAAGAIEIRLARPARRNAFDAAMRDALAEALTFALDHPDAPPVVVSGEGPAFSAGGDLDEFGQAADVGWAHLVRTLRSPARLAQALGGRLTARLHGACVGAGIEVPAAAARVTARPDAVFRLPEVSMGLIPGAGGTATIPRRIGRHRAAWMAVSGAAIDATTALAWGLIDEIRP